MWFSFGRDDIGAELMAIRQTQTTILALLAYNTEVDMATNDELTAINAALTEAGTEIPAKLDELLAQVGDSADPALVAEIRARASALADIVPNSEPEPTPEPEPVPEPEAPVADDGTVVT